MLCCKTLEGGIVNIQSLIHTDIGLTRESVALSPVKHNAEQAQRMNDMVQQKVQASPANEPRGTLLDILV